MGIYMDISEGSESITSMDLLYVRQHKLEQICVSIHACSLLTFYFQLKQYRKVMKIPFLLKLLLQRHEL